MMILFFSLSLTNFLIRSLAHTFTAAVVAVPFWLMGQEKVKYKISLVVAFIHDSVFSALLICYNQHAVLRSFLLKMANIQSSYECPCHFPVPAPPFHILSLARLVKDCKSILKTLNSCCVFFEIPDSFAEKLSSSSSCCKKKFTWMAFLWLQLFFMLLHSLWWFLQVNFRGIPSLFFRERRGESFLIG